MKRKPQKLNIKIFFFVQSLQVLHISNSLAEKLDEFVNFQGLKANLYKILVDVPVVISYVLF